MKWTAIGQRMLFVLLGTVAACVGRGEVAGSDEGSRDVDASALRTQLTRDLYVTATFDVTLNGQVDVLSATIEARNDGEREMEGWGGCYWVVRLYALGGEEPVWNSVQQDCSRSRIRFELPAGATGTWTVPIEAVQRLPGRPGQLSATLQLVLSDPAVSSPEFDVGVVTIP